MSYRNFVKQYLPVLMMLVTFGTCLISFNGYSKILNETHQSFQNTALALVIAIISSILMWVAWTVMLKAIERPNSKIAITAIIIISIIVQIMITAVSSAPGVVGFGGEQALEAKNGHDISRAENYLDDLQRYDMSVRALIPEIQMAEARFRTRGIDEYENGTETGTKGRGAVSGSNIGIADRLTSLMNQLELASQETDQGVSEAQKIIERMRRVTKTTPDAREAAEKLARLADRLRTIFIKIERKDISGMIIRTLDSLPNEISSRENYSRNSEIRAEQVPRINAIRKSLSDTTIVIEEHFDELEMLKVDGSYELVRMTAMKATLVFATDLVTLWAASLTIDWTIWVLMMIFIVQNQWNDRYGSNLDDDLDMTLGEILRGKRGAEAVTHHIPEKKYSDDLHDQDMGKKRNDDDDSDEENPDVEV